MNTALCFIVGANWSLVSIFFPSSILLVGVDSVVLLLDAKGLHTKPGNRAWLDDFSVHTMPSSALSSGTPPNGTPASCAVDVVADSCPDENDDPECVDCDTDVGALVLDSFEFL